MKIRKGLGFSAGTALLVAGLALAGSAPAMAATTAAPNSSSSVSSSATDSYQITVGGTVVTLKEGQKATFGMELDNPAPTSGTGITPLDGPKEPFPGDAGLLTVWGASGKYHYDIAMSIPATTFSGVVSITDLATGFSGGSHGVTAFTGSVATSNYKNHLYSGNIDGEAYLVGIPVAHTVPNYYVWKN